MSSPSAIVTERIALGTVQLGLPYGRHRNDAVMPVAAAEQLLEHAWECGIRAFDTAEAYGVASARLAAWLRRTNRLGAAVVYTKVQVNADADVDKVAFAAERFDGTRSLVLLSHGHLADERWRRFADAVHACGAESGQSVYVADEVAAVAALPAVARVQCPGNVLDGGCFAARGSSRARLDVRSAFLQGVLLDSPYAAEQRVPGGGRAAEAVARAAAEIGHRAPALLVATVLARCAAGDRIVVGADMASDLDGALEGLTVSRKDSEAFARRVQDAMGTPSPALLDPRSWPG